MNNYYELLNINKDAEPETIKKAYKKNAFKFHPDRNPNDTENAEKKFKEIAKAYEVLSDPEKRKLYDEYGEDGLQGNFTSQSPYDIFEQFFGTSGGMNFSRGGMPFSNFFTMDKMEKYNIKLPVKISFKDSMLGTSKKIGYKKQSLCNTCNGCGSNNSSKIKMCDECKGSGMVQKIKQVGIGMFSQNYEKCTKCKGIKKIIPTENICLDCNGMGLKQVYSNFVISIPKGAKHGETQIIHDKGNFSVESHKNGNLIIIYEESDSNEKFIRKNNNLIMEKKILLSESLCGLEFFVNHPNGKKILIKNEDIIKPKEIKVIYGLGFPIDDQALRYGDLIIQFDVIFPSNIDNNKKELIYKLLPTREKLDTSNLKDIVEYNLESFIEHDDEEEEDEQQSVQCAQQ